MRTLVGWSGVLLCGMLMAGSVSAQVTQEEIAAQAAAVVEAQTALDSLTSLARAEALQATLVDSAESQALAEAGVEISISTPAQATGKRDPEYVDIDIPYTSWDTLARRLWVVELRSSGLAYIQVSLGKYTVHRGNAKQFVALVETFLASMEEGEE